MIILYGGRIKYIVGISCVKLDIEDYNFIFMTILKKYSDYCYKWLGTSSGINLKRLMIKDIYTPNGTVNNILDNDFQEYMYSFLDGLDDLYLDTIFCINIELPDINKKAKINGRTKCIPSITDKIIRKVTNDNGEYAVNKYLNDLLGFRIIDPFYKENIDNVHSLLESYKVNGISVSHKFRENNGYKGYHVYFKVSNKTFPIEIQIWDKSDEQSNIQLHNVYKQEYLEKLIIDFNTI